MKSGNDALGKLLSNQLFQERVNEFADQHEDELMRAYRQRPDSRNGNHISEDLMEEVLEDFLQRAGILPSPEELERLDSVVHTEWFLPRLTDYWDFNKDAIITMCDKLSLAGEERRDPCLAVIRDSIREHLRILTDTHAVYAGISLMDDLYKAANTVTVLDVVCTAYLDAFAATFNHLLSQRGFVVHYLVDNSFEPSRTGMQRPLVLFGPWFAAAGMTYICPQEIASRLMQYDGVTRADYITKLPQYIHEARDVMSSLVEKCHSERRHYLLLDTDWQDGSFSCSKEMIGDPGVITIIRNEAPIPGSKVDVHLPPEIKQRLHRAKAER